MRVQEVDGAVRGIPEERCGRGEVDGAGKVIGEAYLAGAGVEGFPEEAAGRFAVGAETVGRGRVEGGWDVARQTCVFRNEDAVGI